MNSTLLRLMALLMATFSTTVFAVEATGTGSTNPGPLIRVWAEVYSKRIPDSVIKYQGSSPADGIKRLVNKEVDFSTVDMPLGMDDLKKNGLIQFPFVLEAVAPIVNLPNVYPGQLRLDGKTLGDIFLGNIKKWNDPAIVALNPNIRLPDANIIIIHRETPPGISTIIGDYLAKTHPQWRELKGNTMSGTWPANTIEVKNPPENLEMIKKTLYSIGYGPVALAMKNGMAYVQMKNKAGNFVSPSDENVSAAAEKATWDESTGFNVVLSDQPGATSWPITNASFVLMLKTSVHPERSREVLKYFKYSLRYGGLKAVEHDYIALPASVAAVVHSSWKSLVDDKGEPVLKD